MAKFITNIQLQDADEEDYDLLAKELKKESFKNEQHAANSDAYVTGNHAFSREGNLSLQDVSKAVYRAASRIGKKCSFYVLRNKAVVSLHHQ